MSPVPTSCAAPPPRLFRILALCLAWPMVAHAQLIFVPKPAHPLAEPPGIDGPPPPVPPAVVARDERGRVTLRATRLEDPLVVDGRLDEPVYGLVEAVGGFIQQEPFEGEPATEATDVWVLYDDRQLYVSVRCWDTEPARIVAKELRRGNVAVSRDDHITLTLDTFYDRRNGFFFQTNPLGAVYEALITDERTENIDWDTVWDTRSAAFEGGWSLEIVIPFKSLRYPRGGAQVWGLNVRRFVPRKNEFSYLSPVPASYGRSGSYKFSSSATLVGLEVPTSGRGLEIKPYGITTVTTDRTASPPLTNDPSGDGGLDVKLGLTKGLVADVTYNTDFAQVEADEAQVNLTRFSLFFPEKRPFFLEGQDIFAFGGTGQRITGGAAGDAPIIFFSRRIGLRGGQPIPIVAGGRVTGRAGPYSIGLLDIQTDAAPDAGAPRTNFAAVRVKRNIFSRSSIGMIGTNRSEAGGASNQAYGIDARLALLSNLFVDTYYARTRTPGRTGNDASVRARIENNGDRYGFQVEYLAVGADFNPEVGFLRREDFRRTFGLVRFSPRPAGSRLVRKYLYEASLDHITSDSTGVLETRDASARVEVQFNSGDRWDVQYRAQHEFLPAPFEITRGVVLPVGGYDFQDVATTLTLGPQRRVAGRFGVQSGTFFSGDRTEASYSGRIQLSTRLSVEPAIAINWVTLAEGRFTTRVGRVRVIFAVTPRMFVEALSQYTSATESVDTNIRYRWEYQPGSDLYVVYSEGRDARLGGIPTLLNRALAVKMTRLFRF